MNKPGARTLPTHSVPAATSASCEALDFDPDPELAATIRSAAKRNKARRNARDLALKKAREVGEQYRELGVVWEGE